MRVCIITTNRSHATETFVRMQIDRLDGVACVMDGGFLPTRHGSRCDQDCIRRIRRAPVHRVAVRVGWMRAEQADTRSIRRILARQKIDIVLAEHGPVGASVWEVCRDAHVPLVVHFHGADAYQAELLSRFRTGYAGMFDYASAIIAVSSDMMEQLRRLGVAGDRLMLVPYGVDEQRFTMTRAERTPPHFIAVGRFVEKKNPILTLAAFRQVLSEHPDSTLTMVGDGPLLGVSKQYAASIHMQDAVTFAGMLSHDDVALRFAEARAFIQHSVRAGNGDCEGTPLAVLEAMASGLPVVATRHGGIMDVVLEGSSGFLVDELDVTGMAKHMAALVQDPALAGRMGCTGRQRIETHYTSAIYLAALHDILRKHARHGS